MTLHALEAALLRTIRDRAIVADTVEDGLDALADRLPMDVSRGELAEAVRHAVGTGLFHEPVRLPPGALQCHWHLELTRQGRQASQAPFGQGAMPPEGIDSTPQA